MGDCQRILGVDFGVASCGWATSEVVRVEGNIVDGRFAATGVWEWDPPEEPDKKSNLKQHGQIRRRRRLLDVRQERLRHVKQLLAEYAALPPPDSIAAKAQGTDPWRLRRDGLDRMLSGSEWAMVLCHMAGHRAYLSNSKRNKNEKEDEKKKLLKALVNNEREFESARSDGKARTIGEWLSTKDRQRNRRGDYRYSIKREWVRDEAILLFERQRVFGNPFTSASMRERYLPLAFEQGKITPPSIGPCTFEPTEPRAAKHSYSFELFRLLQRLTDIRIISSPAAQPRALFEDEIRRVVAEFGERAQITYKTLRRLLKLGDQECFTRVNDDEQEKQDIVTRSKSGHCAPGTRTLRTVIIDKFGKQAWQSLLANLDTLDGIAAAIAHRDDLKLIRNELEILPIDPAIVRVLTKEADGGELGFFKGTGHLSIKALRKLIPSMLAGRDYHRAQIAGGYDPSKDRYSRRPGIVGEGPNAIAAWLTKDQIEKLIPNQVVSRAVREVFKQVLDLWRHQGPFDAIHLEMAREIGKSARARKEIEIENNRRRQHRTSLRNSFVENFNKKPSDREFERWTLWCEQQGKCPFTPYDRSDIPCRSVLDGDERVQVEHILPRSRFNLESLDNKVLCLTGANQNKANQTPYEWLTNRTGGLVWEQYREQVKVIFRQNPRKLANLLIVDTAKLEKALPNRALNDTRWISKFLLAGFAKLGNAEKPLRVQPVNAAFVDRLRWAWGLAGWKHDLKDRSRRRADDRHHAMDAAIAATVDAGLVNRLTKAYQRSEDRGDYFEACDFDPPWKTFRCDLLNMLYGKGAADAKPSEFNPDSNKGILVSRGERRRARGQMHKETAYALTSVSDAKTSKSRMVKVERKAVDERLDIKDLLRVKDAERNHKLVETIRSWIEKGRPANAPPVWKYKMADGSEYYEPILSISLVTTDGPGITPKRFRREQNGAEVAFASFDRYEMVRVDVFESSAVGADARYLFVPVYVHQTVDSGPPQRTFTLRRAYDEWPLIQSMDRFLFSVYKFSLLEIETDRKAPLLGYYRGLDVNDGRIKLTPQYSRDEGLGVRFSPTTINLLKKFTVDRLGRKFEVSREVRTWRGKACI